ncbi:hypothetical protein CC86DRAFT_148874 [Ophiobolus disseminans]|uniref:Uncharacterized protein n=1 Tax=Ophiobolus disseminans TaxID=1469910 RepID=A0A6A6ZE06_9PLEO|nr:hypothetical protein CC86DRAFT_148874 [Ophiobolus disseminans]
MEQTVDTPMKGDSRQEDDGFQSDTPVDQIMDAAERRRMQNRTAQRNHLGVSLMRRKTSR